MRGVGWVVAVVWLAGCATSGGAGGHRTLRDVPSQPGLARTPAEPRASGGSSSSRFRLGTKQDDFQLLQQTAGLEQDARHETDEELELSEAQTLWEKLERTPATLNTFAPRRALGLLLRQVLAEGEEVAYAELLRRTHPFGRLVVMRPDGYLASALDGRALQRMGHLELREGRLMVGPYEVGAFCWGNGGVFYAVDTQLQPLRGAMLGELGLEHDWLNSALDGAQDAVEELVLGMAAFVLHPIRSAEGLAQLPSAVAALIASSPGYFARYSALPLREQIREAARLSTHLMTLYGSAGGAAMRVGSVGARLPVLSLTVEGALALEQVAVPAGAVAAAVGTGTSAVYVLMTAQGAPKEGSRPTQGPGQWKRKKFAGSERSRRYQEQISGRSADDVYLVGDVEYDGFSNGVLKEAKAEGYLSFFDEDGFPVGWYEESGGFDGLINQATNQLQAARGVPLEWHVAERKLLDILRARFHDANLDAIKLVHTPSLP